MSNPAGSKKQRYLVVTHSSFFDVDKLASALVWGKSLAATERVKVDIYLGISKLPKELIEVVSPTGITFREKLSEEYFTLSIDKGDAEIESVRWEEVDGKVKIMIFTEKGEVNTKEYSSVKGRPHYDKVFSFGIRNKEKTIEILGEFAPVWDSSKTVNIDINSKNKSFAQENYIYPDYQSYAQAVLELTTQKELPINATTATELLSALYWKTNSFRNKYTTPESFVTAGRLQELGASTAVAQSKIFNSLSFIELKAKQEIFNNMKLTTDGYIFSRVSTQTAKALMRVNPINPVKNPMNELKDTNASFTLVPVSEHQTLVLATSNNQKLNLKELFKQFDFVGDDVQAEITFKSNPESTEAKIKQIIGSKGTEKRQSEDNSTKRNPAPDPKSEPPIQKSPNRPKKKKDNKDKDSSSHNQPDNKSANTKPTSSNPPKDKPEIRSSKPTTNLSTPQPDYSSMPDPLAPAKEPVTLDPNEPEISIQPKASLGGGFGGFGKTSTDPLPKAKD